MCPQGAGWASRSRESALQWQTSDPDPLRPWVSDDLPTGANLKALVGQTKEIRSKAGLEGAGGGVGTVAPAAGCQTGMRKAYRADLPVFFLEKPGHRGY